MNIILPIFMGIVLLTSCVSADLGLVSRKSEAVTIGAPLQEVLNTMGDPKIRSYNEELGITYLHYCEFGFADDDVFSSTMDVSLTKCEMWENSCGKRELETIGVERKEE